MSEFNVFPYTIMAPETFEALPEIEAKPETLFKAAPLGKLFRAKIAAAWHVVCWSIVDGAPMAIASRFDTRLYQHED